MAKAVWWWLLLGSVMHLKTLVRCELIRDWGHSCPAVCSCHLSPFADLPINYWLENGMENESMPTIEQPNEVFHQDDTHRSRSKLFDNTDEFLRMAMCIFQGGIDPATLLNQVPRDVQVLTLLQSKDSGEIVLEAQHMQDFQDLIYLDVQGYHHESSKEAIHKKKFYQNNLYLFDSLLKPLTSLQYINLQHIKLQSRSVETNEIHPVKSQVTVTHIDPLSNEIPIMIQDKNQQTMALKSQRSKSQKLVFLNPTGAEKNILPYKTYLEQQERTGSSIFAGLSNLRFLRVFNCDLHEVNWEMFEGLDKLQYLSLEQNHLLFIPEFAFYGTPNLKILSISHNKLLNLHSTNLAGLLELEKLDLSHNKVSHLSEFSLPPFPKLQIANFRHNPMETVFANTFEIMNATTTLYIGGNYSTLDIHPNSFLGLQSLRKLNIYNISINLLERQLLSGMPQLKELEALGTITALSFDAFLEVPKLEKLVLKECKIQSVSMDAFYGLYGLLYLDLSSNMLQILPPGLFDQQFSLRELLLQNNLLTELPIGFFNTLPTKMVRLENNPWHCSCTMKDWQPLVINKVKQKKQALCQTEYDKGSMCSMQVGDQYIYDKRVAPRCTTPNKYKGWIVFQVLRKELRCNKKLRNKVNKKVYLKKKYEDYEKSIKPKYFEQKTHLPQHTVTVKKNNTEELKSETINQPSVNMTNEYPTKKGNVPRNEQNNIYQSSTEISLTKGIYVTTVGTLNISWSPSVDEMHRNMTNKENNDILLSDNLKSQFRMPELQQNLNKILSGTEEEQKLKILYDAGNTQVNTETVQKYKPLYAKMKSDKLKHELLTTRKEKVTIKEKAKETIQQQEYSAKAMKKALKLEMERTRKEKLLKYQT